MARTEPTWGYVTAFLIVMLAVAAAISLLAFEENVAAGVGLVFAVAGGLVVAINLALRRLRHVESARSMRQVVVVLNGAVVGALLGTLLGPFTVSITCSDYHEARSMLALLHTVMAVHPESWHDLEPGVYPIVGELEDGRTLLERLELERDEFDDLRYFRSQDFFLIIDETQGQRRMFRLMVVGGAVPGRPRGFAWMDEHSTYHVVRSSNNAAVPWVLRRP